MDNIVKLVEKSIKSVKSRDQFILTAFHQYLMLLVTNTKKAITMVYMFIYSYSRFEDTFKWPDIRPKGVFKALLDCDKLPLEKCHIIDIELPVNLEDLSSDQQYLIDIII